MKETENYWFQMKDIEVATRVSNSSVETQDPYLCGMSMYMYAAECISLTCSFIRILNFDDESSRRPCATLYRSQNVRLVNWISRKLTWLRGKCIMKKDGLPYGLLSLLHGFTHIQQRVAAELARPLDQIENLDLPKVWRCRWISPPPEQWTDHVLSDSRGTTCIDAPLKTLAQSCSLFMLAQYLPVILLSLDAPHWMDLIRV